MQKPELSREEFLRAAQEQLENLKAELKRLHGEPPCFFAIDVLTVRSWTESKREETLASLRANAARAEELVEQAISERLTLCRLSGIAPEEHHLPGIVFLDQIREDLTTYESVLNFVQAARTAAPQSSCSVPTSR